MTLILASKSPRRLALLAALGLTFAVEAADVDEAPLPDEAPDALVRRLCRAKAQAVMARWPTAVVLAADTLVAYEGRLLGKPADPAEAAGMLSTLRGRTHQVYTAVCVAVDGTLHTRLAVSDVTMRLYSDAEIAVYVASGDPMDKAGAYAIQHPRFSPVSGWTGCYTGIMGLPLGVTSDLLRQAGVCAPADVAPACIGHSGRCCLLDRSMLAGGGPHLKAEGGSCTKTCSPG
jgi:septum formation protein